jgi:flavin-dependent dehydrogenase
VLLAGDAARLVNPLTGEGIYYAVLTGLLAGTAAATALAAGRPDDAGRRYATAVAPHFRGHLLSTGLAARLTSADPVLDAGLRAAAADQGVFDDLVELGLAGGTLTPRVLAGLAGAVGRGGAQRVRAARAANVTGMHQPRRGKEDG